MNQRSAPTWWKSVDGACEITVRVVPGAKKSAIAEVSDDSLRIRLAAPAVEGKANAELIRFVAEWFDVRPSAVGIVSGVASRTKCVRVAGCQSPPDTTMF